MSTPSVAAPTPEVSSIVADTFEQDVVAVKKGGMSKAALAIAAIAVVAIGGVLATKIITRIAQGPTPPDSTVGVPSFAAETALVAPAPTAVVPDIPAPVATDSVIDSAADRKLADSVKAVRRARQDSIRVARDSAARLAALSNPFALPGSGVVGLTGEQRREGDDTGRAAIRECVALLTNQNVRTLQERFGSDFPRTILRSATDNNLAVGAALGINVELDDMASGTIVTQAGVLLGLKSDPTGALPYRAELRAVSKKDGATWRPPRCFVDRDGGFKP